MDERILALAKRAFVMACLTILLAVPAGAEDPAVPLPPEVAQNLAVLGEGVVGKALPAPPLGDLRDYEAFGSGEWEYNIVAGGKDGQKVRTESYRKLPDADGAEIWERALGKELVEHLRVDAKDGSIGTALEDDLEMGYTSRFTPPMVWFRGAAAGQTHEIKSKIEAFKTEKPEHISYSGGMHTKLTYLGMYQVSTPAGSWPAMLLESAVKIHIGPAKVSDTTYAFFAKGVGKVAEVESTRIAALLIYHSNTKIAKVLKSYPKR